jgi:hypothetical protein
LISCCTSPARCTGIGIQTTSAMPLIPRKTWPKMWRKNCEVLVDRKDLVNYMTWYSWYCRFCCSFKSRSFYPWKYVTVWICMSICHASDHWFFKRISQMRGRSERESQPCPRDSTVSTFEKSSAVKPLSSQNSDT